MASCYRASLQLAIEYKVKTIAFPAISCGVCGYPVEEAAQIAVQETLSFLRSHDSLEKVLLTCFSAPIYVAYQQADRKLDRG